MRSRKRPSKWLSISVQVPKTAACPTSSGGLSLPPPALALQPLRVARELAETYVIAEIAYDPMRAVQLGQELAERGIAAVQAPLGIPEGQAQGKARGSWGLGEVRWRLPQARDAFVVAAGTPRHSTGRSLWLLSAAGPRDRCDRNAAAPRGLEELWTLGPSGPAGMRQSVRRRAIQRSGTRWRPRARASGRAWRATTTSGTRPAAPDQPLGPITTRSPGSARSVTTSPSGHRSRSSRR